MSEYKSYSDFKLAEREAIDALPIEFAFNDDQFHDMLKKFGLTLDEKDKLRRIPGGGFCLATDAKMIVETMLSWSRMLSEIIKTDDEFTVDALRYELDNHEYGYTGEPDDALLELGLPSDVNKLDDRMKALFCRATELCYYG
jgi:hypothetical protein